TGSRYGEKKEESVRQKNTGSRYGEEKEESVRQKNTGSRYGEEKEESVRQKKTGSRYGKEKDQKAKPTEVILRVMRMIASGLACFRPIREPVHQRIYTWLG